MDFYSPISTSSATIEAEIIGDGTVHAKASAVLIGFDLETQRSRPFDDDERAAARDLLSSSWTGQRWVGDLMGVQSRPGGARLQVVVVVPAGGASARAAGADLARKIGDELFRVCPWARPSGAGGSRTGH